MKLKELRRESLVRNAKLVYSDVLGEFTIATVLGSYLEAQESAAAAAGWGGDRVVIVEGENKKQSVFWKMNWDSTKDANEFFEAYQTVLKKRFATTEFKNSGQSKIFSTGTRQIVLEKESKTVKFSIDLHEG